MTLHALLELADRGYAANGFVSVMDCWDNEKRRVISPREYADRSVGDTLSLFVATEIAETYDEAAGSTAQQAEAIRVLDRAVHDLQRTIAALQSPADVIVEQHPHALCSVCNAKTVPAERVPDQMLRRCVECDHEFFEDDNDGTATATPPG